MSSVSVSLIKYGRPQNLSVPACSQVHTHTHLVITSRTRAALTVSASFNPHQSRVSLALALITVLSEIGRKACEIHPTLKCTDRADGSAPPRPTLSLRSEHHHLSVYEERIRSFLMCMNTMTFPFFYEKMWNVITSRNNCNNVRKRVDRFWFFIAGTDTKMQLK